MQPAALRLAGQQRQRTTVHIQHQIVLGSLAQGQQRGDPGALLRLRRDRVISPSVVAAQAVILTAIELQHLEAPLEQRDGRLEPVAIQRVGAQPGRWMLDVHTSPTPACSVLQQPTEQHGVADVMYMEFVEAQQPALPGDLGGDQPQRIGLAGDLLQAQLHLVEKGMEMHAALARHRGCAKKASMTKLLPRPTPPHR